MNTPIDCPNCKRPSGQQYKFCGFCGTLKVNAKPSLPNLPDGTFFEFKAGYLEDILLKTSRMVIRIPNRSAQHTSVIDLETYTGSTAYRCLDQSEVIKRIVVPDFPFGWGVD